MSAGDVVAAMIGLGVVGTGIYLADRESNKQEQKTREGLAPPVRRVSDGAGLNPTQAKIYFDKLNVLSQVHGRPVDSLVDDYVLATRSMRGSDGQRLEWDVYVGRPALSPAEEGYRLLEIAGATRSSASQAVEMYNALTRVTGKGGRLQTFRPLLEQALRTKADPETVAESYRYNRSFNDDGPEISALRPNRDLVFAASRTAKQLQIGAPLETWQRARKMATVVEDDTDARLERQEQYARQMTKASGERRVEQPATDNR